MTLQYPALYDHADLSALMSDKVNTISVMLALKSAGANGVLASDIVRMFPDTTQRWRNASVNEILRRMMDTGYAQRSSTCELSQTSVSSSRPSYRWWLTASGDRYVMDEIASRLRSSAPGSALTPYVSVASVLKILLYAGSNGALSGVISRSFTIPDNVQLRSSHVGQVLWRMRQSGRAQKSDVREPSPHYVGAMTHRWWITSKGVNYLMSGGRYTAATRAAAEYAAQHDPAMRESASRNMIATGLPALVNALPACTTARDRLVCTLLNKGLSYDEVSAGFGVTPWEVRQWQENTGKTTCACSACAVAAVLP